MPYFCPNRKCPHRKRTGKPAEFVTGHKVCSECGSALVDVAPEADARPIPRLKGLFKRFRRPHSEQK